MKGRDNFEDSRAHDSKCSRRWTASALANEPQLFGRGDNKYPGEHATSVRDDGQPARWTASGREEYVGLAMKLQSGRTRDSLQDVALEVWYGIVSSRNKNVLWREDYSISRPG